MSETSFEITVIGKVHSPYKEKFAIPRQPGLVSKAKGSIELIGGANNADLIRDLNSYSHLWVIFIFHETLEQGWKPLVRPPRLGGNKKTGVLATRSTFRPNGIGMSVVKLEGIHTQDKSIHIEISGLDLLDKTPVVDIKPYIPYSDSIYGATSKIAQEAPMASLQVEFSIEANEAITKLIKPYPDLKEFIGEVLSQDPRPAYRKGKEDNKLYGICLYNFNIRWKMKNANTVEVLALENLT